MWYIPPDLNVANEKLLSQHGFAAKVAGGPVLFDEVGRDIFTLLLLNGLLPTSRLLDIGCGLFRSGYWTVRFLDPHCYYGTESRPETVQIGRSQVLGDELVALKAPRIEINDEFDFSIFGVEFDFAIARSIWSHTTWAQLVRCIQSFAENSSERGQLFASILPAGTDEESYTGTVWSGPVIRHRFWQIREECRKVGMRAAEVPPVHPLAFHVQSRTRQHWIKIARPKMFTGLK